MSRRPDKKRGNRKKTTRVLLRRNRAPRVRDGTLTKRVREEDESTPDAAGSESVRAKGDLSRRRTVVVRDDEAALPSGTKRGTVIALRGLYADVDDGEHVWVCTVRRILRTRLIRQRHPVTVGDRVAFRPAGGTADAAHEGVIEHVAPRTGELRRRVRNRIQTIAANVDRAVIVSSAAEPAPKAHLIDRYIVAAHDGEIVPVICMNKIDLDEGGSAVALVARYRDLDYDVLCTSAVTGVGVDELAGVLKDRACVFAGQSGVGKSSLLNAIQPDLRLKTAEVAEQTQKGRHTTTTATMIRLDGGGYVVDTPGVRSFDLSVVDRNELEMHFIEFVEPVRHCRFPDCTHTHEAGCAVKQAVEQGRIHAERYESYVRMFEEPTPAGWKDRLEH